MKCPLCETKSGDTWSKDILLGKKTVTEAADYFMTSTDVVLEHVNRHYKPDQPTEHTDTDLPDPGMDDAAKTDFYLRELHTLLKQLKDWTTYCIKSSDMSNRDIEVLLKIVRETRDTLKTLGEFEGRINKQAQVQVNIALINQRYREIENFLLTETCNECRLKVIDLMDKLATSETPLITSGQ